MKNITRSIIALVLALLTAALLPVQALAETPDYISEVKVAMGSTDSLKGYIVLADGNKKPFDLNQTAGSTGYGAKGNKAVYLGYKTTKKKDDAITDLAVMNMKGNYDTKEYDALMEGQMKSQIIPFVDKFLSAIKEYRLNYNSNNKRNKTRAKFMYDMLNTMTDDDCGGVGLGDLLLNETKYEMGDAAYNKLSDSEKKKHADILTIVGQANGTATITFENLITRAADTEANSWIDRFKDTTYDDLINSTGKAPTDARKEVAKLYDDDVNTIVDMWKAFSNDLNDYSGAVEFVKSYDINEYNEALEEFNGIDENTPLKEAEQIAEAFSKAESKFLDYRSKVQTIAIYNALKEIKYVEGSLLDFFTQSEDEIAADVTALYPLAASLSNGQKAGLEFVSLKELCSIAITDESGYNDVNFDYIKKKSIYDGVDRAIYDKGGVGLTADSLRGDVEKEIANNSSLGGWSIAMIAITGAVFLAFAVTGSIWLKNVIKVRNIRNYLDSEVMFYEEAYEMKVGRGNILEWQPQYKEPLQRGVANSKFFGYLSAGIGVALVIFTAITIWLSFRDMAARYKTKFTPMPKFMIDEKDLIGYNKKGEKIVLKNQSAYYKLVECNRSSSDENYNVLGTGADMNGDVGQQWLALYAVKHEQEDPIIASSLKVQIDQNDIPAGYTTGIHMFGSDVAFNLNAYPYSWNKEAKKIQVYFKRDTDAKTTGSTFTAGTLAIAGVAGLFLGVIVGAFGINVKKRNENVAAAS